MALMMLLSLLFQKAGFAEQKATGFHAGPLSSSQENILEIKPIPAVPLPKASKKKAARTAKKSKKTLEAAAPAEIL